jgi:preprotein translocase subunit SecA
MRLQHAAAPALGAGDAEPPPPPEAQPEKEPRTLQAPQVRGERKIGRNEPCPCGSGRKYKHCHGTLG